MPKLISLKKRKSETEGPERPQKAIKLKQQENVMVIPKDINMTEYKADVLTDYRKHTPKEIVKTFKAHYKLASARTMLSKFKKELSQKTKASDRYLGKITLPRDDQLLLRGQYKKQRHDKGLPDQILRINYVDVILTRARQWIRSPHVEVNIAAIYALSGHRFIEIIKTVTIRSKAIDPQPETYPEFWGCVNGIAKQKPGAADFCRNKIYLAPVHFIIKALVNIRKHYPTEGLTNVQVSNKYAKTFNNVLKERYCDLFVDHSPSVYTFRYMYGLASFKIVGERLGFALNQWLNRQLGHSGCVDAQILGYQNTFLNPDGFRNHTLSSS